MTEPEIWKALTDVFRSVFDDDELVIETGTTANDVDGWDSLTHIRLVVAIEERFKVHFNTGQIIGLKNVGEMVQLITSCVS
jgi:acyl carrier protein